MQLLKTLLLLAVLSLVAATAFGCGSGDSNTVESGPRKVFYPKGPTREFYVVGGDNAVQLYGHEATGGERAQASKVIERWMRARAAKDHAMECSYLARSFVSGFVADATNVSNGKVTTCPQALAYFGTSAGGVNHFDDTTTGPIDSLRIESGQGYAQYHGNDGRDYIVPMAREDGGWKVSTAAPFDRADAE
ncbi:MAG TPA: hypothetical protein VEP91_10735 [Solirubrobacterales bacterium]|nr:hypothetical protein [Solirubrobacterales bacterium]